MNVKVHGRLKCRRCDVFVQSPYYLMHYKWVIGADHSKTNAAQ